MNTTALVAQGNGTLASTLPLVNGLPSRPAPAAPLPFAPTSVLPPRPNLPEDPVIPVTGFATPQEAEKAFVHLLRKAGVDETWTWDRTMRAIITDPLYKALGTLAEKKAAWQKVCRVSFGVHLCHSTERSVQFVEDIKTKATEESQARLNKARPGIKNLLKNNPNVHHYTTFPTADRLFSQVPAWNAAKVEAERKQIFEEYVTDLQNQEVVRAFVLIKA